MRPGTGLEIVIPKGMKNLDIPGLLERHKEWIVRVGKRVLGDAPENEAPDADVLVLHGGSVRVPLVAEGNGGGRRRFFIMPRGFDGTGLVYETAPAQGIPYEMTPLPVPEDSGERVVFLRGYIREYARRFLGAWLESLRDGCGLAPAAMSVRMQRSRWGSCSAGGKLSLNACLVFLPPALCRHILLHELCHLRHMNHGEGFWKLLFALEPDALTLDKKLRGAWKHVPGWVWG